jgi:hypothetical protein
MVAVHIGWGSGRVRRGEGHLPTELPPVQSHDVTLPDAAVDHMPKVAVDHLADWLIV